MNLRISNLSILLLLMTLASPVSRAQTHATLLDDSRLWIDGSTSVNTFTCEAGDLAGDALFYEADSLGAGLSDAEVAIPVSEFDCGKARMNRDLHEALKAEDHPLIRFRLTDLMPAEDAGNRKFRVRGMMDIAGESRSVQLDLDGERLSDNTWRATGGVALRMSDFGIDPPTALLGLIQAHDDISVRFDLRALTYPTIYAN